MSFDGTDCIGDISISTLMKSRLFKNGNQWDVCFSNVCVYSVQCCHCHSLNLFPIYSMPTIISLSPLPHLSRLMIVRSISTPWNCCNLFLCVWVCRTVNKFLHSVVMLLFFILFFFSLVIIFLSLRSRFHCSIPFHHCTSHILHIVPTFEIFWHSCFTISITHPASPRFSSICITKSISWKCMCLFQSKTLIIVFGFSIRFRFWGKREIYSHILAQSEKHMRSVSECGEERTLCSFVRLQF